MKKVLITMMVLSAGFIGLMIAHAQAVQTNIDSINVNFDSKTANIALSQGYYDESNAWHQTGMQTTTIIVEPAFDTMINQLSQANALNLNAVEQAIQNSI